LQKGQVVVLPIVGVTPLQRSELPSCQLFQAASVRTRFAWRLERTGVLALRWTSTSTYTSISTDQNPNSSVIGF